jgi:hypothetical protein
MLCVSNEQIVSFYYTDDDTLIVELDPGAIPVAPVRDWLNSLIDEYRVK